MNQSEEVAMKWAAKYLRGHHCDICGRQWVTAASVGVLMHQCERPRSRRRYTLPPVRDTREELLAEARGQVFHSLEDALGEAALRGGDDE